MNDNLPLKWKKYKDKDKDKIEYMLRDLENYCVTACDRFTNMNPEKSCIWMLCNKKREFSAIILKSGSTLIPVLCGLNKTPPLPFLNGFFNNIKIHSVQGITGDVEVIENELEKTDRKKNCVFDYDLMSLDHFPLRKNSFSEPRGLILRAPGLNELDELMPLRKGYEEEEVLPKGSVFNPKAGRIILKNFIARKKILAAFLENKIAGKIVVNAVSFTRYQIGGVYVLPEYRGLGIASRMTYEFASSIIKEGRGITLFVKKNNIPAKKLYNSLGFKYISDYRITYY